MEIFTRRFTRYLGLNKKGGQKLIQKFQNPSDNLRDRKEEKGKSNLICYKCEKPGHTRPECPENRNKYKRKEKKRFLERKAMIAQLAGSDSDESSSSDEDEEVAHFCLMAKEINDDEVTSYSNNDNLLDEYNELQDAFDELFNEHKQLLLKHEAFKVNCTNHIDKSEYDSLKSEFETISNDKIMLETQVIDLTCSLEKFTHGMKMLDNIIGPKRAPNDKSGIGFDNDNAFVPKYNRVRYNYNTHDRNKLRKTYRYKHDHVFDKNSHYFKNSCIHCSLHSHESYFCPNRFKINEKLHKWVVKTRTANH